MIGAAPRTGYFEGLVGLDDKGFIVTGEDARHHERFAQHRNGDDRQPLLLETTQRNLFAVGDVRSGSVKRVGAAIGEGAAVVPQLHAYLTDTVQLLPGYESGALVWKIPGKQAIAG